MIATYKQGFPKVWVPHARGAESENFQNSVKLEFNREFLGECLKICKNTFNLIL
jgi:hypothetical protein